METRYCAYCSEEIPFSRNRNSKYCCDECYYENKKNRAIEINKLNNHENPEILKILIQTNLPGVSSGNQFFFKKKKRE